MDDTSVRAREAVDDAAHSATADKAKGHSKELLGKAKEKVGSFIGDRELQAEGIAQNAEGKKDRLKGEIKEAVDDVKAKVEAAAEVVKDKIDEVRNKR